MSLSTPPVIRELANASNIYSTPQQHQQQHQQQSQSGRYINSTSVGPSTRLPTLIAGGSSSRPRTQHTPTRINILNAAATSAASSSSSQQNSSLDALIVPPVHSAASHPHQHPQQFSQKRLHTAPSSSFSHRASSRLFLMSPSDSTSLIDPLHYRTLTPFIPRTLPTADSVGIPTSPIVQTWMSQLHSEHSSPDTQWSNITIWTKQLDDVLSQTGLVEMTPMRTAVITDILDQVCAHLGRSALLVRRIVRELYSAVYQGFNLSEYEKLLPLTHLTPASWSGWQEPQYGNILDTKEMYAVLNTPIFHPLSPLTDAHMYGNGLNDTTTATNSASTPANNSTTATTNMVPPPYPISTEPPRSHYFRHALHQLNLATYHDLLSKYEEGQRRLVEHRAAVAEELGMTLTEDGQRIVLHSESSSRRQSPREGVGEGEGKFEKGMAVIGEGHAASGSMAAGVGESASIGVTSSTTAPSKRPARPARGHTRGISFSSLDMLTADGSSSVSVGVGGKKPSSHQRQKTLIEEAKMSVMGVGVGVMSSTDTSSSTSTQSITSQSMSGLSSENISEMVQLALMFSEEDEKDGRRKAKIGIEEDGQGENRSGGRFSMKSSPRSSSSNLHISSGEAKSSIKPTLRSNTLDAEAVTHAAFQTINSLITTPPIPTTTAQPTQQQIIITYSDIIKRLSMQYTNLHTRIQTYARKQSDMKHNTTSRRNIILTRISKTLVKDLLVCIWERWRESVRRKKKQLVVFRKYFHSYHTHPLHLRIHFLQWRSHSLHKRTVQMKNLMRDTEFKNQVLISEITELGYIKGKEVVKLTAQQEVNHSLLVSRNELVTHLTACSLQIQEIRNAEITQLVCRSISMMQNVLRELWWEVKQVREADLQDVERIWLHSKESGIEDGSDGDSSTTNKRQSTPRSSSNNNNKSPSTTPRSQQHHQPSHNPPTSSLDEASPEWLLSRRSSYNLCSMRLQYITDSDLILAWCNYHLIQNELMVKKRKEEDRILGKIYIYDIPGLHSVSVRNYYSSSVSLSKRMENFTSSIQDGELLLRILTQLSPHLILSQGGDIDILTSNDMEYRCKKLLRFISILSPDIGQMISYLDLAHAFQPDLTAAMVARLMRCFPGVPTQGGVLRKEKVMGGVGGSNTDTDSPPSMSRSKSLVEQQRQDDIAKLTEEEGLTKAAAIKAHSLVEEERRVNALEEEEKSTAVDETDAQNATHSSDISKSRRNSTTTTSKRPSSPPLTKIELTIQEQEEAAATKEIGDCGPFTYLMRSLHSMNRDLIERGRIDFSLVERITQSVHKTVNDVRVVLDDATERHHLWLTMKKRLSSFITLVLTHQLRGEPLIMQDRLVMRQIRRYTKLLDANGEPQSRFMDCMHPWNGATEYTNSKGIKSASNSTVMETRTISEDRPGTHNSARGSGLLTEEEEELTDALLDDLDSQSDITSLTAASDEHDQGVTKSSSTEAEDQWHKFSLSSVSTGSSTIGSAIPSRSVSSLAGRMTPTQPRRLVSPSSSSTVSTHSPILSSPTPTPTTATIDLEHELTVQLRVELSKMQDMISSHYSQLRDIYRAYSQIDHSIDDILNHRVHNSVKSQQREDKEDPTAPIRRRLREQMIAAGSSAFSVTSHPSHTDSLPRFAIYEYWLFIRDARVLTKHFTTAKAEKIWEGVIGRESGAAGGKGGGGNSNGTSRPNTSSSSTMDYSSFASSQPSSHTTRAYHQQSISCHQFLEILIRIAQQRLPSQKEREELVRELEVEKEQEWRRKMSQGIEVGTSGGSGGSNNNSAASSSGVPTLTPSTRPSWSLRFFSLLRCRLIPYASRLSTDLFKSQYKRLEVSVLMKKHSGMLRKLWMRYAKMHTQGQQVHQQQNAYHHAAAASHASLASGGGNTASSKPLDHSDDDTHVTKLDYREFASLLRDAKVLDGRFLTLPRVYAICTNVQPDFAKTTAQSGTTPTASVRSVAGGTTASSASAVASALDGDSPSGDDTNFFSSSMQPQTELIYTEYLECLAGIASCRYANPYKSLHWRLQQFLERDLSPWVNLTQAAQA